ncbi:MAG: homoserine dehydrogenase, partial [Candidatus Limnocylindrales bacterium]
LSPSIPRTDDLAGLALAPDIDVVVELIGGLDPAGGLVADALEAGRSVVTANKALLAERGAELEAQARRSGAALRFEAAVGGGVPILGPLAADLAANHWTALRGIVNGSTNLILTRMAETGEGLEACLAAAQGQGILEADPAADLEGLDAARKLAILIRLAFGAWVPVDAIGRTAAGPGAGAGPAGRGAGAGPVPSALPGILGVTAEVVAAARRSGRVVKLVAQAERGAGETLTASVLPVALAAGSALAQVDGLDNRIELEGEPIGRVAFSGPGAGGAATSSAVLGDLIAIARGGGSTWAGLPPAGRTALLASPDRLPALEGVG